MEDLDQYNGDAEHDMWVDFDYHELRRARGTKNEQSSQNTGELSEYFDDSYPNGGSLSPSSLSVPFALVSTFATAVL